MKNSRVCLPFRQKSFFRFCFRLFKTPFCPDETPFRRNKTAFYFGKMAFYFYTFNRLVFRLLI